MERRARRLRGFLFPWLGFLLLLLEPAVAFARAGGGQSYSGGGHGGGGGGGDGGLIWLLIRLLIWLIFHHPLIGVPLTIVLIYAFVQYQKSHATAKGQSWDSAPPREPPAPQASRDMDDLRTLDPEFSVVLFEDLFGVLDDVILDAPARDGSDEFTVLGDSHLRPWPPRRRPGGSNTMGAGSRPRCTSWTGT